MPVGVYAKEAMSLFSNAIFFKIPMGLNAAVGIVSKFLNKHI